MITKKINHLFGVFEKQNNYHLPIIPSIYRTKKANDNIASSSNTTHHKQLSDKNNKYFK